MSFLEVMSDSSFLCEIVSDMQSRWFGHVDNILK
jgi:hypothetical protein